MRLRTLLLLLLLVSGAAMAVIAFLLPDPPEVRSTARRPTGSAKAGEDPAGLAAGPAIGGREAVAGSAGASAVADLDAASRALPASWPRETLVVRVREEDGRPAPGVALHVESDVGPHLDGYPLADSRAVRVEATAGPDGSARFEALPVGAFVASAEASDGRRVRREFGLAPDRGEVELVLPARAAPRDLVVRVVGAGGAPVPGARVEVFGGVVGAETGAISSEPALAAESDAEGTARFADVECEGGVALARHADGRAGRAAIRARSEATVVELAAVGTLEGSLVGLPAESFLEARVLAYALDQPQPYYTVRGAQVSTPIVDGKYRFESLPAGAWTLALADPGGARIQLPTARFGTDPMPNSLEPLVVDVLPGRESVRDLDVVPGGSIEGLVLSGRGTAVAGALVRSTFAPSTSNFPDGFVLHGANVWRFDARARAPGDHPTTHASARTDSSGRYRLSGLAPGRHRVEVLAAGLSYDRREGVEVEDGGKTELEHALEPAGAIQGVEPRAGYLGVTRDGSEAVLMIAILPGDGRFTFAGLPAGRYTLAQFHSDASVASVPLADVDVEAGRTTWIDLSRADRPVRFLGRVVDQSGPVPDARVRVYPETFTTDAGGRFEMRSSFPFRGPVSVQVRRGAVETWFSLEGWAPDTNAYERDLALGSEEIHLRTVDAVGRAVPARVEITTTSLRSGPPEVETLRFEPIFVDERGERAVRGLLPGAYAVRARFEDGSESEGLLAPPETSDLELRVPPSARLEVVVRGPESRPAHGLWVSVEGPASPLRWGETDVEGRTTFRGVGAGDVTVRVRSSRPEWSAVDSVLAEQAIALAAGEERTLELAIPTR